MAAGEASLSRRTMIGAAWMVAWRMGTRLIGLLSTLILARVLIPADFGLVAMAITFSGAIDSLSLMGLNEALIRRPRHEERLLNAAFSLQALRGLATALVIALLAWPASTWFNEPRLFLVLLALAGGSVLSGLENIGIVEFRREIRFDMEFRLLAMPRVLQVVITIALALLLQSYWALVAGILMGKVLRLIMTYILHPFRPRLALDGWRELIGFSFWSWLGGMASMVWDRADAFIIGPALGAAALGTYVLGMELALLPVTEFVAPAAAALFAGVARARTRDSIVVDRALPIVALIMLAVVPISITLSAMGGQVVHVLLGAKWSVAGPLVSIFALVCLMAPFSFVCTTILLAEGRVRENFYVVAASALFKIVLLGAVVAQTRDPKIIAAASLSCNLFEGMLFLMQLRRVGPIGWHSARGALLRIALTGLCTAILLQVTGLGWRPVPTGSPWHSILFGGMAGFGALACAMLVQLWLWRLAGRPAGPEARALEIVRKALRRRFPGAR